MKKCKGLFELESLWSPMPSGGIAHRANIITVCLSSSFVNVIDFCMAWEKTCVSSSSPCVLPSFDVATITIIHYHTEMNKSHEFLYFEVMESGGHGATRRRLVSSYFAPVLLRRLTEHGREAVSPAVHRRARAAVLETGQRRREAMPAAHYPWADRLQCSTLLRVRLCQSMAQSHAALSLDHAAAPLATLHLVALAVGYDR